MKYSKHNIFSTIKGSDNYYLVNPLSGNADILTPAEAEQVKRLIAGDTINDEIFLTELQEKGYISDPKEEQKLFRTKYLDFLDHRDQDEIQIFFVPNYACNFACSYCYQDEYAPEHAALTPEIIEAFFQYVQKNFAGRKKYLTLFGGEPLLQSSRQHQLIASFLDKAEQANMDTCIVTNGYSLTEYIPELKSRRIREIQITLDGTEQIHNQRRFLKDGSGTFKKIVEGIDACLANQIPVNLRMVIDKENINNLPVLAQLAMDRKWTQSPVFKTQIGRNYELHHCQSAPDKLFSRISLYEQLYQLIVEHPHITTFYRPAYSISKFLSEQGSMPDPLFDSCPACKTEWAFDYTGKIYSCTATVGKQDEVLGTFYPEINLNEDRVATWENRDVATILQCTDCAVRLACGGGCGSVAKNKFGSVNNPDCRPVKELLEIGFAAYFES